MNRNSQTIKDASISRLLSRLIVAIKNQYNINNFIETGTNLGETAEWASEHFGSVITIEFSDNIYEKAIDRRGDTENVEFIKGKSQNKLNKIVLRLDSKSIFYLDAHTGGCWASEEETEVILETDTNPCPILDEIKLIGKSSDNHFIFIDDAPAFITPPKVNYKRHNNDWADIDIGIQDLIHEIENIDEDYYIASWEGSIIAIPPSATDFVKKTISDIRDKEAN